MPQLEHMEAIEKHLWSAADTLLATTAFFIAGLLLLLTVDERRGRAAAVNPD